MRLFSVIYAKDLFTDVQAHNGVAANDFVFSARPFPRMVDFAYVFYSFPIAGHRFPVPRPFTKFLIPIFWVK